MIIGKKGNQNSGVEYGDIRPGLISRRVKKKGGRGEKLWEGRGKKGEREKMWEGRGQGLK